MLQEINFQPKLEEGKLWNYEQVEAICKHIEDLYIILIHLPYYIELKKGLVLRIVRKIPLIFYHSSEENRKMWLFHFPFFSASKSVESVVNGFDSRAQTLSIVYGPPMWEVCAQKINLHGISILILYYIYIFKPIPT